MRIKKSIAGTAILFSCAGLGLAACAPNDSDQRSAEAAEAEQRDAQSAADDARATQEALATAEPKIAVEDGNIATDETTRMAIIYSPNDVLITTPDADQPWPALSQIKLYIGQYVVEEGTDAERELVTQMISRSNDALAEQLFHKYPESIDSIAEEYDLENTIASAQWGDSETSVVDLVNFISTLREQDPDSPVLEGMKAATVYAADGYRQDYGLARLPDAEGVKLGWSDNRLWHSSTAFGDGYVVAAITSGTKATHVEDVAKALEDFDSEDLSSAPSSSVTYQSRIIDINSDDSDPESDSESEADGN